MSENKNSVSWFDIIIGIVFIVVAFIALRNPAASLISLIFYFGFTAIFKGILSLIAYNKLKKLTDLNLSFFLIISILDIIFGLLIVFNIEVSFLGLPIFFGIWFILDSLNDLIFGRHLKKLNSKLYTTNIVSSILSLILGVIILFNPVSGYLTIVFLIGSYFMLAGIRSLLRGLL